MAAAKKKETQQNQYDERRETLVVEEKTVWPADVTFTGDRSQIARALHSSPKEAKVLEYIRCPSGFVRVITVSADDLSRLGLLKTAG